MSSGEVTILQRRVELAERVTLDKCRENERIATENRKLRAALADLLSNIWESEYGDDVVSYHAVQRARAELASVTNPATRAPA